MEHPQLAHQKAITSSMRQRLDIGTTAIDLARKVSCLTATLNQFQPDLVTIKDAIQRHVDILDGRRISMTFITPSDLAQPVQNYLSIMYSMRNNSTEHMEAISKADEMLRLVATDYESYLASLPTGGHKRKNPDLQCYEQVFRACLSIENLLDAESSAQRMIRNKMPNKCWDTLRRVFRHHVTAAHSWNAIVDECARTIIMLAKIPLARHTVDKTIHKFYSDNPQASSMTNSIVLDINFLNDTAELACNKFSELADADAQ